MKNPVRLMYALVNYDKKIICDPQGNFFTHLPKTLASVFCFSTRHDAERVAKGYRSPKLEVLEVNIDKDGSPSPVVKSVSKRTAERKKLNAMGAKSRHSHDTAMACLDAIGKAS